MKDRSVGEIVDQVLNAIPDEHKHYFDKVLDDLLYTAPEVINNWFNERFLRTFNNAVPNPPIDEWHFNAVAALTRKTVEQVREEFTVS